MAFAPDSVSFDRGDGSVRGQFREKDFGLLFEFSRASETPFGKEYDMLVWVGHDMYRYAKVLKTVAYIVVDEDADGNSVIEKWQIKNHREYPNT